MRGGSQARVCLAGIVKYTTQRTQSHNGILPYPFGDATFRADEYTGSGAARDWHNDT